MSMPLLVEPLALGEIKRLVPQRHGDARGYFVETFNKKALAEVGISFEPVQENQSYSRQVGTVRGLHFQAEPFAQAKLVRVLRGRIFDVALDIRRSSTTFGAWVGMELSALGGEQILIPAGFAHGFCTLDQDTEIAYLVDAPYSATHDRSVSWNDPDLAIDWPPMAGAVISAKDAAAPGLAALF
jgi:dTDP-4-dehydrorhamnose 3,5-epimerase